MERKTPTKTIWWPQPGAFELTEFKSTIVLLADWVPGPAGGPPAGARRLESRCGTAPAPGTKCDVDVMLIIFASFRPGSDTRRSGGRQYRAAVARSPRRCTRLAGPLPRTPDNAARTGSHSRAARNQMVPKRLSACSAERARPPCRSEEHTSELQSQSNLVCRLLLGKKQNTSELQSQSNIVCHLFLDKKDASFTTLTSLPESLMIALPSSMAAPLSASLHPPIVPLPP